MGGSSSSNSVVTPQWDEDGERLVQPGVAPEAESTGSSDGILYVVDAFDPSDDAGMILEDIKDESAIMKAANRLMRRLRCEITENRRKLSKVIPALTKKGKAEEAVAKDGNIVRRKFLKALNKKKDKLGHNSAMQRLFEDGSVVLFQTCFDKFYEEEIANELGNLRASIGDKNFRLLETSPVLRSMIEDARNRARGITRQEILPSKRADRPSNNIELLYAIWKENRLSVVNTEHIPSAGKLPMDVFLREFGKAIEAYEDPVDNARQAILGELEGVIAGVIKELT